MKNIHITEIKQYTVSIEGEQEQSFTTIKEMSEKYKLSIGSIHNIITGKKKTINVKNKTGKLKIRYQS